MAIDLNGTTGVTTTGLTSNGIDDNATSTAMTINTSGNVGIGTSSPAARVHAYDPSTDAVLYVDSGNANGSHMRFLASGSVKHFAGSGGGFGLGDVDDYAIRSFDNVLFSTGNSSTERMRIDSSGSLLVGKTSADFGATAGFEYRGSSDILYLANDADKSLALNRNTSDGEIISFRKNDSTVGSIGVEGNDITIDGGVSNHSGLRFSSPAILPRYNGALADSQVDLGQTGSNYRFKDLYLSGGVYLGGTGSANKLDDYEEGTWTATFYSLQSGGGTNHGTQTAKYVKIGNTVTVSFRAQNVGTPISSVGGLPFAMSDDSISGATSDGELMFYGTSTIINFRSAEGSYARATVTYIIT